MQIELKRGHASNVTSLDKPEGAVECNLDNYKILLHRDLADKISEGDEIVIAGRLHDNQLYALAVKNISSGKTGQLDPTTYSLAMGVSGFILILCFVESINYLRVGDSTIATGLALVSFAGLIGIVMTALRIFEISRAARQIKYGSI